MVEIQTDIVQSIKDYLKLAEERGITVNRAYLFGSYALGNQHEFSDIDLAIISRNFEGTRVIDREKLIGLSRQTDYRISPYPITPEDFEQNWFVKYEIIDKGIRIV